MSITGDTANHDQFVHSAEVCALFPTRLDRLRLNFSHYMVFEKRMTETQSFRNNHSLLWMDRYTYFPLHLLVHLFKRSCNLLNYARAHNSLRLHTEVSSMKNLMIPLNLGGGPKEKQAIAGIPRCLNPPRCVFKLPP